MDNNVQLIKINVGGRAHMNLLLLMDASLRLLVIIEL